MSSSNLIGSTSSFPVSELLAAAPTTAGTTTTSTSTATTPPTATTTGPTTTPVIPATPSCPAAGGSLTATTLGSITLGMTRRAARSQLTNLHVAHGWAHLCLSGGGSSRFEYPSHRLLMQLSPSVRNQLRNTIVIALTANPHYSLNGIRSGSTLAAARSALTLTAPIHVGSNRWYFISRHNAVYVLKVHTGHVRELGLIAPAVGATRSAQRRLLHSL